MLQTPAKCKLSGVTSTEVTSTERHWLPLAVVFLFLAEQPEWNSPSALCGCLNLCLLRTHKEKKNVDTFTLKVNGYVCYDIPGKVTSVKRQTPNNHPSLLCLSSCLFNFPQRMFFFFEDTWKCKQESPLLTPPHPTPRARPRSLLQLPKCPEGHTASSVYDKGPDSGVTSICPFQRTSEKETGGSGDGDGVSLWLASFIRRAHGCLLINTPGTGASDPETSRVSVGLPPRSVCGTKHPLRQPTATTGSHQLQYV